MNGRHGMLYHLPKAVLPIELVAKGGALELRVQPSKPIADPQQRYLLKHPTNVFASDNVKVEWDSSGLLLSKLTMDSTDQSLNVLKRGGKGGGRPRRSSQCRRRGDPGLGRL